MTPQQDDDVLLITRKEFVELANVHTEGISPARIFEITLAVKDRSSHPAPSPDPRVAFFEEDNAYKDSIIEQQRIHINTLNVKMSEMMQGAAAKARNDVTIDDFCIVDLTLYIQQSAMASEDVSRCRGKECNYCGKFNESLRTGGDE